MSLNYTDLFSTYQIALVQMAPEFLNRDANLEKAEKRLREAAANGAKLVCFPESFDLGYTNTRIPEMAEHVHTGVHPTLTRMCALAKELKVHILAPVFYRNQQDNIENRAFLIDDEGTLLGGYSKTHLTADEKKVLVRGESYPVFETKLGKIGIAVCYDICFPEVGRLLALNGAQVLLVPAAWRGSSYYQQWWDIDLSSRALDNLVYVAGINMTGPANRQEAFAGKSQLCGPTGEKLCECGNSEETVLYGWIDLPRILKERQENTVLFDRHPLDYRRICVQ